MTKVKCDLELECKFNRNKQCIKDEISLDRFWNCESYEDLTCEDCKIMPSCNSRPENWDAVCDDFEFKESSIGGKELFEKLEETDIFSSSVQEES